MSVRRPIVSSKTLAGLAGLALGLSAHAQPEGTQVVRGQASISSNGSLTQVRVSNNAILRHESFDIAAGNTVQFIQPSADARVLNRIGSASPTRIDGTLLANGRVYLVNPAGIFFGSGSVVNAGGLIAAAGKMSDRDYLRGVDRFTELTGDVIASGDIGAGDVVLAGSNVRVDGTIRADRSAILVSGDDVLVRQAGSSSVHVKVGTVSEGLSETRTPRGLGAGDTLGNQLGANRVVVDGSVRARTIHAESAGATTLTGELDTSGRETGRGVGGAISVLGERVTLQGATINSTGDRGGGQIHIGGAFQGLGDVRTSQGTSVDDATLINSSALNVGNAGQVVVWSDDHTSFDGTVQAMGGARSGDGALVEVSGKQTLAYSGSVRAGATNGRNGTLLLDPKNITISASPGGQGVSQSFTTNAGSNSQVSLATLLSTLAGNTNVTLQANNDINWRDGEITFFNSTATLTLQAGRSVLIDNLNNGFTKINASGVNINIIANDSVGVLAAGTQANRDAGPANVTTGNITPGGNVSILVRPSTGAFQAGSVTVGNVSANRLTIDTGGAQVSQVSNSNFNVTDLVLQSPTGSDTAFNLSRPNVVANFAADIQGVLSLGIDGNSRIDAIAGVSGVRSTGIVSIDIEGTLTQTHAVVAPQLVVSARQAGVGSAIVLGNVDNDVDVVALDSFQANGIDASARSIVYRDLDEVSIDGVTTAGTFTLTAGGAISQTLPIQATTGLFVTTRSNAGAAITLNTQGNTANSIGFQALNGVGNATVSADMLYRSLTPVTISDSRTNGLFSVLSNGAVNQNAGIFAQNLSVGTRNNAGAAIDLTLTDNQIASANLSTLNAAGSARVNAPIDLFSTSALSVSGARSLGAITLTSNGAMSQTGAIEAGVLAARTRLDSGASITLTNASNDVATLRAESLNTAGSTRAGGIIAFNDANGYDVAQLNTNSCGDLRTESSGATITQSAPIVATQGLALRGGSWTLTNASNTIPQLAAINTVNVNVFTNSALLVASVCGVNGINTSGFARLIAPGTISQTRPVIAQHLIARALGGASVTLADGTNNVQQLTLESRNAGNTAFDSGTLSYRDADGFSVLRLGTNANTRLQAGGTVNQAGNNSPIVTQGLTLLGGAANYTFDRPDNSIRTIAGNTASANLTSNQPVTVGSLDGINGFNATSFLRIQSTQGVNQTQPITGDLLVVRTLNNDGAPIDLLNPGNTMQRVNFQVRNAANTAFTPSFVFYRGAGGYSVVSLGTLGSASLEGTAAVNQVGASLPITVAGLQTFGTADFTLDNTNNAIGTISGDGNSINVFSSTPISIGAVFSTVGINVSNFFRVQSRGDITQTQRATGTLLVARTLSDTFTQVLLTNQSNNFSQINMQSRNSSNSGFGAGRIVYADTNAYSIVSLGTNEQAILRSNSGTVNQNGASLPITLGQGLRLFGAGNFTLNNTGNSIPALAGSAGRTEIFTNSAFRITQLGTASGFTSADDFVITARGAITQDRFLRGINLNAKTLNDAGANIILTGPGNNFTGSRILRARNSADTADVSATVQYAQ